MKIILSIKHWLLFLILITPSMIAAILAHTEKEYEQYQGGANLISVTIYFIWIWAITHFFSMKLPNSKLLTFKICFFCALLAFLSLNTYFLIIGGPPELKYLRIFERLTFVLWLYCLSVSARLLKSWELSRSSRVREWLLYVVLLLLFPIGVWIIQPKMNRAVLT